MLLFHPPNYSQSIKCGWLVITFTHAPAKNANHCWEGVRKGRGEQVTQNLRLYRSDGGKQCKELDTCKRFEVLLSNNTVSNQLSVYSVQSDMLLKTLSLLSKQKGDQ